MGTIPNPNVPKIGLTRLTTPLVTPPHLFTTNRIGDSASAMLAAAELSSLTLRSLLGDGVWSKPGSGGGISVLISRFAERYGERETAFLFSPTSYTHVRKNDNRPQQMFGFMMFQAKLEKG